ncbi:MAG TPA: Xaa-Pro peptidase family protein [candidate division Zixibacteria bacterium]|nr:Xaa-Pro peptidase family protein [candidate division Zixibacteria bacterium]
MTGPDRLAAARRILDELEVDGLLVSRSAAKRWLSGFALRPGEEPTAGYAGTLVVTRDRQLVLADGRYLEQARAQAPGWEVRRTTRRLAPELADLAPDLKVRRLAAEASVLSHADWAALEEAGLDLVPADAALARLRLRKGPDEVAAIARACALTDACFEHLLGYVHPGLTERQVARQIAAWFDEHGAEALAFEPLVLVGPRAAMPHGHATEAPVTTGQPLLLDFGCQVDGYRSDMTRTVWIGSEPDAEARRRYEAVREAQQRAFEAAAPGVTGVDLDAVARGHLADAGLAETFLHGLGHGIGLETHEAPILREYRAPLEAGMVITLEPGTYHSGELGIRIEDTVHLTDAGAVRLTDAPRELLVIG